MSSQLKTPDLSPHLRPKNPKWTWAGHPTPTRTQKVSQSTCSSPGFPVAMDGNSVPRPVAGGRGGGKINQNPHSFLSRVHPPRLVYKEILTILPSKWIRNGNTSHQIHSHPPGRIQITACLDDSGRVASALARACSPRGRRRAPVPTYGGSLRWLQDQAPKQSPLCGWQGQI